MEYWNVVITIHEGYYKKARELLKPLGSARKTEFFNVLVMQVSDTSAAMEMLNAVMVKEPQARDAIARFVPVAQTFNFSSADEFASKAQESAMAVADELEGKKFHVRMHRRGFKKRISSLEAETFLDRMLLEELTKRGAAGTISFTDPDAVIAIETVGQMGGLALFTREELARYSFLHLD
jgi:tRNA(Ser,Leu) C12 N-acetylase TAN1